MCIIKKHNIELKRMLVSNHCVASIKNMNLVDMCLFSGEGKPTLLGGFAIAPEEAMNLGRMLQNSAAISKPNMDKAEKVKLIRDNIVFIHNLLESVDKKKADELAKLFEFKKAPIKKHDTCYIG